MCLAFRLRDWFLLKGALEKEKRFLTDYRLCFIIGLLVSRERRHLYEKSYVLSFSYNLLHLLMKSCTEGSIRVVKDYHLETSILVAHHKRILERDLRHIDLGDLGEPFLREVLFGLDLDDRS